MTPTLTSRLPRGTTNGNQPPRLLIVDPVVPCQPPAHVWSVAFAAGDPCQCGSYRLHRAADGELRVEAIV